MRGVAVCARAWMEFPRGLQATPFSMQHEENNE
jgi:hypothetical protein